VVVRLALFRPAGHTDMLHEDSSAPSPEIP